MLIKAQKMAEQLIKLGETARRLGISRRQFYRLRALFIAYGLQEIIVGQQRKYREASLDRLIQKAAEKGDSF